MKKPHDGEFERILRGHGIKVTLGRTELLKALSDIRRPVSAATLIEKTKSGMDMVTVYRNLELFVKAGIVGRVDWGHDHAHYEFLHDREHHHHAVCTICGDVEDVHMSGDEKLNDIARRGLKRFGALTRHSLEFFGICKKCESKARA